MRALLLGLFLVLGCDKAPSSSGVAEPATSAVAEPATSAVADPTKPVCGTRPGDWCPSPAGDPCGSHKNVDACKADKACQGMRYKGESFVACRDDGSGFAANCPTVGCISR